MSRNRAVERALQNNRGPLIATVVIVALGLIVLAWVVSPTERKRRSLMGRVEVGDDTAQVVQLLGDPVRCGAPSAELVRGGLPRDWPPPAVGSTIDRLEQETTQRWVYPINPRRRIPCETDEEHTEVGIDRDGRVLWFIAVTGRTGIALPESYSPSGEI